MKHTRSRLLKYWQQASEQKLVKFPYEYMYQLLDEPDLRQHYQIPIEHSWVMLLKKKGIPIFSPGIEDSTLGNMFAAAVMDGSVKGHHALKSGTEQLQHLCRMVPQ